MERSAVPPETAAPAPPGALFTTPDEVVAIVKSDARFRPYAVTTTGAGFVEIGLPEGGVVLAWPELWRDRERLAPHLVRARSGYSPLLLLGNDADFAAHHVDTLREEGDLDAEPLPLGRERLALKLHHYRELCRLRRDAAEGELLSDRYRYELDELNAIGRALSSQRDIDRLLALILEKARYVTAADAGSVYVVEGQDEELARRRLRFKVTQNDSAHQALTEFTLPVSAQSIVGRCVLSREVINIPDLYRLDEPGTGNNPWGFKHNREFDAKIRYQTHSMLTVPMIDAHEQVIGVIQLINRKRRPEARLLAPEDFGRQVVPFDMRAQELAATLASQAGISIENALLYDDIKQLFEGFVRASVTAIESRDPTTSGHSQRVADLTVALAKVTDGIDHGPYAAFSMSRDELKKLEYASLLHDFGKVGVRENVLVKAKKLYEHERELILSRFDFIRKSIEADHSSRKLEHLIRSSREEALARIGAVDEEYQHKLKEIDDFIQFILKSNEPTVLDQGGFERIADIAKRTFADARGQEQPYLRPDEARALQILRGSLTPEERLEIESHVSHTIAFLERIPWGRAFVDIPLIAGAHHEKLDGTGYPNKLAGEVIPVPSKMMAICDIFDALSASDRPYKKAVPTDKALDIIGYEVKSGKCDPELFRIFVEARVYDVTTALK